MGKVKKINAALNVAADNAEPIPPAEAAAAIAAAAGAGKRRGVAKKNRPRFQSYLKRMAKDEKLPVLSSNVIEIVNNATQVLLNELFDGVLSYSKGRTVTRRDAILTVGSYGVKQDLSDKAIADLLAHAQKATDLLVVAQPK